MMAVFSTPNSELAPLTTAERLERIQDYLTVTSSIHLKQSITLRALELFSAPERYQIGRGLLRAVVEQDMTCAWDAMEALQQDVGHRIYARRLSTGEIGVVAGLEVSDDPLGYMGHIALPDKSMGQWILNGDIQLTLK